jgi:hypothetical protein
MPNAANTPAPASAPATRAESEVMRETLKAPTS